MIFNEHPEIKEEHAFLSPSQYHWLRYDKQKLRSVYLKHLAVERGTQLHEFAAYAIRLGKKLEDNGETLSMYVNDAIDFQMTPEQKLVFSENCHGTADAISFRRKRLRIHDLKTGSTPAHMEQLQVYAALFCLEYKQKPKLIQTELRIYQANDVLTLEPDPEMIEEIMNLIIEDDKEIEKIKSEMRR